MRLRKKDGQDRSLKKAIFLLPMLLIIRGKWNEVFNNNNPVYLELGCGRGKFLNTSAQLHPRNKLYRCRS